LKELVNFATLDGSMGSEMMTYIVTRIGQKYPEAIGIDVEFSRTFFIPLLNPSSHIIGQTKLDEHVKIFESKFGFLRKKNKTKILIPVKIEEQWICYMVEIQGNNLNITCFDSSRPTWKPISKNFENFWIREFQLNPSLVDGADIKVKMNHYQDSVTSSGLWT
jgi:hypothetical protein